jgi:CDP-glucose 4,6-dehydratase
VTGIGLAPATTPALFQLAGVAADVDHHLIDIARQRETFAAEVAAARPEVVIHLAAQAILARGLREPVETFAIDTLGTAYLLDALRTVPSLKAVLVVTTDKVYETPPGASRPLREGDPLGGETPYAASKAAAEHVTRAFAASYFEPRGIAVATARGGNVIGGGDFSEGRLVADIYRAVKAGDSVVLRRPDATRPWQHVLDCLSGYFAYAAALASGTSVPRALNFGPGSTHPIQVRALTEAMLAALGAAGGWKHVPEPSLAEVEELAIDSTLARKSLGWSDRLPDDRAIAWTADWYRSLGRGEDMRRVTLAQIVAYERLGQ